MRDAREALARECDLADSDMRKWVRVPVKHVREALAFESTTPPSEEDVARFIGDALWGEGGWLGVPDRRLTEVARAVLALFPGRTEIEVKAEGWDEGAQAGLDAGLSIAEKVHANGGTLNLAFIPNAPVNPYRKESDRG